MTRHFHLTATFCLGILFLLSSFTASAETLKGKLSVKGKTLSAGDFTLVAQTKSHAIRSTPVGTNGKFTFEGVSSSDRISVLYRSNFYSPLVLAVRSGKSLKQFKAAARSRFCRKGNSRVILATKKKSKGALAIEVDPAISLAYSKSLADDLASLAKGASAKAGTDCLPSGISSSSATGMRTATLHVSAASDPDGDGVSNETDLDDDDDGVADAFDSDNDDDGIVDDADPENNDKNATGQLFYFQQLHLDRENSYHPKIQAVTDAVIDNALRLYGGLALEAKSGVSVELDCGGAGGSTGLPWCTSGGTGRSREPYPDGKKFPEELDSDGDGKGDVSAGGTGDMQLLPGATSTQILPGDTFIEEVTDSSGGLTKYVGVLNSVVLSVPGIVSITTSEGTYTFDYPALASSIGTYDNPVLVPSTGEVNATFTVYPPVYNTPGGRIVPGVMTLFKQIPNGPCTYDSISKQCSGGGSGPGLLPGSLYSDVSAGWTIMSDGVRSNTVDKSVEEATAATYTVNLTGTGGVTGWDAGEYLKVPVQASDSNGTTSAHNVIFRRKP